MSIFKHNSIKDKLISLITFTNVVILFLAFLSFMIVECIAISKGMQDDLSSIASMIGLNSTAALLFNDKDAAEKILDALAFKKGIIDARIYFPSGEVFAQYPNNRKIKDNYEIQVNQNQLGTLKAQLEQNFFEGIPFFDKDNSFDRLQEIFFNNNPIGYVYIRMDMKELYNRATWYLNSVAMVSILFFCVTYMIARLLQRQISEPILDLSLMMRTVSKEKDYSLRADKKTNDELGILIDGFNDMLTQIQIRDQKLEQYTQNLEKLVEERTLALSKTNEDLVYANQELKQAQSKLIQSAKLASIGELAAGVAHELNQPLMVIRTTTQMLKRSLSKNTFKIDKLDSELDVFERNTKRMMNIINHLRAFSRQSETAFVKVDVNKVIADSFLMVSEQLRLRNIEVNQVLSPDLPEIQGEPNQLEQVFLNLITNARDAIMETRNTVSENTSDIKKGKLEICTKQLQNNSQCIEICFKDNGCGIPEKHRGKIFDPFFTTKEVGKGTGLGLSISYGIMKDHGGEIEVIETGQEGTTISVRLPIA
ncbi:MAG: HAMP domain-containing protein [Desulfobacterales bacterium]|nr:HAMP domain-containing protein [Desulfobacterales bacterium]